MQLKFKKISLSTFTKIADEVPYTNYYKYDNVIDTEIEADIINVGCMQNTVFVNLIKEGKAHSFILHKTEFERMEIY